MQHKFTALPRLAVQLNAPAQHTIDQGIDDVQPQAGDTLAELGGKEGVKDFFLVLGGNAAAIIAHAQAQPPRGGVPPLWVGGFNRSMRKFRGFRCSEQNHGACNSHHEDPQ